MKEYWLEVSNDKFNVVPAVTHPNETDPKLRTGIANNFTVLQGGQILIDYIMMEKNKYGPENTSYFPNYEYYSYLYETDSNWNQDVSRILLLFQDAESKIKALSNQGIINFDGMTYDDFVDPINGGVVIIVFAGSHLTFKGIARGNASLVRGMAAKPEDIACRIDGFSNTAHEFGHSSTLKWAHSAGGRYCLMNTVNTRDLNCPSHPNPLFKIREGWLDVIPLEHSQHVDKLSPVVSSNQVGLVTIYGKPSTLPDFSCGESYILENRKRIGFDKKIVRDDLLGEDFQGGLLIWHYATKPIGTIEPQLKLIPANGNTEVQLQVSAGDVEHFFAYKDDALEPFKNLDTSRTYSSYNLKTGIWIEDIEQNDYFDVYSGINFNLNYLISEPTNYDHVIYNRVDPPSVEHLSGLVYFHDFDNNRYFNIEQGTVIETSRNSMIFAGMEAIGNVNNLIKFRGAGYKNQNESHLVTYGGITVSGGIYGSVDSLIMKNVKFENSSISGAELLIDASNSVAVALNNITGDIKPNFEIYNIILRGGKIAELELSDVNLFLDYIEGSQYHTILENSANLVNANLTISAILNFEQGIGLNLLNSSLRIIEGERPEYLPVLDRVAGADSWSGIYIEDGNAYINKAEILNSTNRITIIRPTGAVVIDDNVFTGNLIGDISIYDNSESQTEVTISNNTFNSPDDQYSSIDASELYDLTIENNEFINSGLASISLSYCFDPVVKNNIMTGTNEVNFSCGIISEGSSGYYECNTITNFNDFGIFLLNSQPTLFNNLITGNAYGLYVTNNSFPVLSPYFTPSITLYAGGFNRIEYNSNEEIYVEDDLNPSEPYMLRGENTVQDFEQVTPDILIYNGSVNSGNIIYAETNYWGGDEPDGRFDPEGSVEYDPWMTEPPSDNCQISLMTSNNSGMNESLLMFGSALQEKYNGNYSNSDYLFRQLAGNNSSAIKKVIALSNVYYTSHLANENLGDLRNYFLDFTSNSDTIVKRKSRDMAIETRVSIGELEDALDDYDNIINTSQIPLEIFYAQLGKLRVLRQISFFQQGDNTSFEIPVMSQKLFDKESKEIGNLNEKKPRFEKYIRLLNEGSENTDANKISIDRMVSLGLVHSKTGFNPKRGYSIHEQQSDLSMIPDRFQLFQNYPNPFNPETKIKFLIPSFAGNESFASLVVYDITGREIVQLLNNQNVTAGINEVTFDGRKLSSGVYFYKLEVNGKYKFSDVRRMVLVK